MRTIAATVAAIGALAVALPSYAQDATPVRLDPSPDARGRNVVNAVIQDYIAQRIGIQVETGLVDIEGNGTAEIVARFVHSESCREKASRCRTVILRYGPDKTWKIVFDRPADTIALGKNRGAWTFSDLYVDGVRWTWKNVAYAPSRGVGEKVTFSPVPRDTAVAIAAAFGQGATKLASAPDPVISFEFARPKVGPGEHLLVRMKGEVACGDPVGCPVRLLEKDGSTWRPILEGATVGDVEVSKVSREGRNDIVLGTKHGYVVMGWSGKSYGVAEVVEPTAIK